MYFCTFRQDIARLCERQHANNQHTIPIYRIPRSLVMSLLALPNELTLLIWKEINRARDLNSLIKTTRHFPGLLTPLLHDFAAEYRAGSPQRNALIAAAHAGHLSLVRLLVERKGYDINVREDRESVLLCAVASGSKEVVEYLLQKGWTYLLGTRAQINHHLTSQLVWGITQSTRFYLPKGSAPKTGIDTNEPLSTT